VTSDQGTRAERRSAFLILRLVYQGRPAKKIKGKAPLGGQGETVGVTPSTAPILSRRELGFSKGKSPENSSSCDDSENISLLRRERVLRGKTFYPGRQAEKKDRAFLRGLWKDWPFLRGREVA